MRYFQNLETIDYALNGKQKQIKNLFNKIYLQNLRDDTDIRYFQEYTITEGETPEEVSYKFYGTTDYWWIVCIVNRIEDVFYDWPMRLDDVIEYSEEMLKDYPNDTRYDLQALITENDEKRFIKVLKESYLNNLMSDYLTNKTVNRTII